MNRLIFLFPAERIACGDGTSADEVCRHLIDIAMFLDYEKCAMYWDEDAYKAIRGKIEGPDRTSMGLRRNRLQHFTHYKHLPQYQPGAQAFLTVDDGSGDISEEILGRYALHQHTYPDEPSAIVCHPGVKLIGKIVVLSGGAYANVVDTAGYIRDNRSAAAWFADNRRPQRVFNFDAPKHKANESYKVDGVEVSPLVGTEEQINHWLHNAIGVAGGRRLMHYAEDTQILYIFSDENRTDDDNAPIYHGHQLSKEKKAEFNRLPSQYMKKIKVLTGTDIRI